MATKGASNRYGNARGGRQGYLTKKIGFAWAKGFNRSTVDDHFSRHGRQMGHFTKEAYIAHAVKFSNTIDKENCESFVKKGSTYKYNRRTNTFAIITDKGVVITYFHPTGGYKYYLQQKRSCKNE